MTLKQYFSNCDNYLSNKIQTYETFLTVNVKTFVFQEKCQEM
jgi:hypothetical protein